MKTIFEKEVLRLTSRNRSVKNISKILKDKKVIKRVEVAEYLKQKGFDNVDLALNTLKFLDYSIQKYSIVDVDYLRFVIYFSFYPKKVDFDENGYTWKQLRELKKLSSVDVKQFSSSNNWKEIKFRSSASNCKTTAEVFVAIKEQIMQAYLKFVTGNLYDNSSGGEINDR